MTTIKRTQIRNIAGGLTVLGALVLSPAAVRADDRPTLHVGSAYSSCYIDLHSELTADQFHLFAREFADAGTFVQMSGARSLPPWQVGVGVSYVQTFVDDATPQWNNTFTHPTADHWLGQPAFPMLQARLGLPRRFQGEVMFTADPNSNWGLVGAGLRAPVLSEADGRPVSVAARVTYVHLLGPEELGLDAGTVEGIVSRSFGRYTPFVGVAGVVSRAVEKTPELALGSTTALGARGTAGIEVAVWRFRFAGQAMWAAVPSVALSIGGVI
jgi:hypothetical protein